MTDRQRAVEVARRIMAGDLASEEEAVALVAQFQSLVPDPNASALIFWPDRHPLSRDLPEDERTAERIVDLAFRYRPIEL